PQGAGGHRRARRGRVHGPGREGEGRARGVMSRVPARPPHARGRLSGDQVVHAWGRAQVLPHSFFQGRSARAGSAARGPEPGRGPERKGRSMSDIESLSKQAMQDIAAATSADALEGLRVALLGKGGSITARLKALGTLPAEERKAAGEAINRVRDAVTRALAARRAELEDAELDARLAGESIDVTLPGRDPGRGTVHPISRTMQRMADIFGRLGYDLADG